MLAGGDDADVMSGGAGDDLGFSGPWLDGWQWDYYYGGDGVDEFVYENNSTGDAENPHPPADWVSAKPLLPAAGTEPHSGRPPPMQGPVRSEAPDRAGPA